MAKTKFFTELVTGDSAGGASKEDLERGFTDAGTDEMPEGGIAAFFMPDEGGGFLGRPKGWER